jgi:hypothetical protein
MVTSIAGPEVAQFLAAATHRFGEDISSLDSMFKKLWWARLGMFAVCIMLCLAFVIFMSTLLPLAFVFLICGLICSRRIYFLRLRNKRVRFFRELVEWIKANRGPLYAKGIRPRPGHGGVFILFEVNAVS